MRFGGYSRGVHRIRFLPDTHSECELPRQETSQGRPVVSHPEAIR